MHQRVFPCSGNPADARSLWQNPVIQAIVRHRSTGEISFKAVDSHGDECWFNVGSEKENSPLYHLFADRLEGLDERVEEIVRPDEWPSSTPVDKTVDKSA